MTDLPSNLVVYDWGFFRGMTVSGQINSDHDILLPDTIFQEIAGSVNPPTFARKLFKLLRSHGKDGRVFIGYFWNDLSKLEAEPFEQVDQINVINPKMSNDFCGVLQDPSFDPGERILDVIGETEVDDHETRRTEFVNICEDFTRWATEKQAELIPRLRSDVNEQMKWVKHPDQVIGIVNHYNNNRFDSPQWREALSPFPDVHAIGRWARIMLWYILRRLIKPNEPTHKFENNWDDAHYAFLASYTKRIATRDKDLRRLVTDLYEGAVIYDS